jgi:proteasome assembly chaperone (PAC2) family protein
MNLVRVSTTPDLVAPVLVAAFDGWIDAAGASSAAVRHLAEDGEIVASFDDDVLFDYRSRRPVLDVIDGTLTRLMWPEMSLKRTRHGGRDLLVLSGPEPDFHWRELGEQIMELAVRLGVTEWVSLGAIPAAVAHTRPVPVLATASSPGLLRPDEQQGPQGLLRVPSAALSVIELAVSGAGVPAIGFYAQVPNYVGGPYASATIALLEHLGRHIGVDLPLEHLPDDAVDQRGNLDSLVAAQPEAREYLERLEQTPDEEVPSGDEIASEIERFLREQGSE